MTKYRIDLKPVILAVSLVGIMIAAPVFGAVTGVKSGWNLTLLGEHESILTQEEFEKEIDYHQPTNHFASIVDTEGKVWDGMPLWEISERVNEESEDEIYTWERSVLNHDEELKSYFVTVTGSDGKELTLKGEDIFRNNNYIIANTVNGNPLTLADEAYPLVLIAKGLPQNERISGISKITLNIP